MLRLVLVTPYEIWEIYKCFRTERIEDINSSFEHPKNIHGDITRTQNERTPQRRMEYSRV